MPDPKVATDSTTNHQPQQPPSLTIISETPVNKMPTTNNEKNASSQQTPHPTMGLTIDKFPTLPSITTKIHPDTEDTPDIGDFSDDSVKPSLAVAHSKPIPTTFKRPRNTTSDSKDNPTTSTLNRDLRNAVIKTCRKLHKYNFREVDKLQNINMDKKRRIVLKAMR